MSTNERQNNQTRRYKNRR